MTSLLLIESGMKVRSWVAGSRRCAAANAVGRQGAARTIRPESIYEAVSRHSAADMHSASAIGNRPWLNWRRNAESNWVGRGEGGDLGAIGFVLANALFEVWIGDVQFPSSPKAVAA